AMSVYRSQSLFAQVLVLIASVVGLVWWFYGTTGIQRAAFALAFLALMVPPPVDAVAVIAPTFQRLAAVTSGIVLGTLQIPVQHPGTVLSLPGLRLEVAEECAGLRFLLILFVFTSAFARLLLPTFCRQLALIAVSIPVAVLANVARVSATTAGAYVIG